MIKIASREYGQGRVLVCLHGYGGSVIHWDQFAAELSKIFKVVLPNLSHLYIGKDLLTFSTQIDLIADFIKTNYPNEKIFLAGISYGGALSWGIATRYPDLVEKVVFINPMPPNASKYFAISSLRWFLRIPFTVTLIYYFLSSPFGKLFLRQAARVFRNLQGEFEDERIRTLTGRKLQLVSLVLWKFAWILRNEDWNTWQVSLTKWNHDCLLIYDRKDPLFHPEFYDGFATLLSSHNVVTTQDAGHISIMQQPKLIAGIVREYLLRDYYQETQGYTG